MNLMEKQNNKIKFNINIRLSKYFILSDLNLFFNRYFKNN